MSEKTVRRVLKEIEMNGMLEYREIGNRTVYVVVNEDMIPSFHQVYRTP
ncbi:hypothetical protein [Halobacterium salinarum]|nr:hypothetical protein [Halobacterium salinarum]MDL0145779.1 hypothetical protein [Halobacterium salinarum]